MKFCQPHWDALRAAIDERGLSGFVATDGQRAAELAARSLDGEEETLDTFDPLMGAHWIIVSMVDDLIAHWIIVSMVDDLIGGSCIFYDGCPLCMVRESHEKGCTDPDCAFEPDKPIKIAADAALARYRELTTDE